MFSFRTLFQACLYCYSFASFSDQSVLCEHCLEAWRKKEILSIQHSDFTSRSLLVWHRQNPSAGDLIKTLKQKSEGSGDSRRFHFMAHKFWTQYYARSNFSSADILFIPAPARNELLEDHASLFARELSRLFGSPTEKLLRRTNQEEQKGRSKMERAQSKLELTVPSKLAQSLVSSRKIVFVDDLLVSGETARAAYLALGKPENFEAWTIAYRPLFFSPSLAENRHS